MSQHDYNLANQSGANFRADLNNALGAIATNNSGSSEPSTTFAYEWWVDTSNNVLKIRNSANNAWITLPISVTADNTVDINGGTVNGISSFSFSSGSTVTTILDEDNLASDSATALATQQSIKAYVDSQVTAQDLDISDGSSSISIDLDSESLGLLGGTGLTATASGNNVTFAIGQAVGTGDNVQFNQVTSALVGNASTATALATARAIALSGDVVGTANFDGTAGISISTTIQANSVALGTDTTGNYVATIAGTTNEIEVSGSGSETASVTVGLPDDVTIAGNLTVNGTTTTVNTSTLSVQDPLIKLANNNSGADSVDIGFYGLYDTSGSQDLYAGLFRDANDSGKFKLFKDLQAEPTTTVNTSGTGYAVGTLVSNLEGNITSTLTSNLSFADNSKAIFGTGNDLEIYSDGTHSYIEEKNASGNFYIKAESFNVGRQANSELYITAQPNDAVTLLYDNAAKLATATDGIDIKGITSTTFGLNIIDPSASAYGAHFSFDDTNTKVLIGGVTNGTKNTAISIPRDSTQVDFASNITLPDSASIKLGADSDLQLFHDGGNSFIREAGTGNLYIEGAGSIRFRGTTTQENLIEAVENGAVSLYYDNSVKLATTSSGVDVTGVITTDGIESSGNFAFTVADGMTISAKETVAINIDSDDNDSSRAFQVLSGGSGSTETLILASEDAGVTLYYDNAEKLATTSTGVDVTGTVVADGLTVDSSSTGTLNIVNFLNTDTSANQTANRLGLGISNSAGANYTYIEAKETGVDAFAEMNFYTGSTSLKRLTLGDGGDISFYDDTGTSQALFWDASAESLGIGTTSPLAVLDVVRGGATGLSSVNARTSLLVQNNLSNGTVLSINAKNTGYSGIFLGDPENEAQGQIKQDHTTNAMQFTSSGSAAEMVLKAGNVGIGTTSPAYVLDLANASGGNLARFKDSDSSHNGIIIAGDTNAGWVGNSASNTGEGIYYQNSINAMRFYANGSEKARLNSTGIDVTGTVTADHGSYNSVLGGNSLTFSRNGDNNILAQAGTSSNLLINAGNQIRSTATSYHSWKTGSGADERMRIDSSGNLLIGQTAGNVYNQSSTTGFKLDGASGNLQIARDGGTTAFFNRLSSDGDIIDFRKDGSAVGSIGSNASGGSSVLDFSATAIMRMVVGGSTEAMRLLANGNVGIGYSAPTEKLFVKQGSVNQTIARFTGANNDRGLVIGTAISGSTNDSLITYDAVSTNSVGQHAFKTDGSERMRIDASGSLLFNGNGVVSVQSNSSNFYLGGGSYSPSELHLESGSFTASKVNGSEQMRLTSTGLGLGTSSPNSPLEVTKSVTFNSIDTFGQFAIKTASGATGDMLNFGVDGADSLAFLQAHEKGTDFIPLVLQRYGGNVGIGTDSPDRQLSINDFSGNGTLSINASTSGASTMYFADGSSGTSIYAGFIQYSHADNSMQFATNGGSERMRIDSSGNVLIGTTSTNPQSSSSTEGVQIAPDHIGVGRNANTSLYLNRQSDDGDIISFRKDGSAVGSIGTDATDIYIGTTDTGIRFNDAVNGVLPYNTSSGQTDNTLDLGFSSVRWKDLHLSGIAYTGGILKGSAASSTKTILNATSTTTELHTAGNGGLIFKGSGDNELARIDSSGRLMLGTTSPDGMFRIDNAGQTSQTLITLKDSGGTGTHSQIQFNNTNGLVGQITTSGSATTYATSSDARLKDVTGTARGLEVINELNPVAYNWKADGKADEGLIAQEVMDIVPNAVVGSEEDMYSMDYSKLVVHLVAGMKEQQELIEDLQTQINNLRGK